MRKVLLTGLLLLPLAACASAQDHRADVSNQDKNRLTVAAAQREIRNGMTTAEVVEVLGSPNMVTTDEKRRESWVYDKISTEKVYSTSSGGLGLIFGGAGATGGAGLLGGLVWCKCCGSAMTPSSTSIRARGASYRYYVCVKSLRNGREACPIRSLPAHELESAVLYQIKAAFKTPELIAMISHCLSKRDQEMAFVTKGERERLVRKELRNFDALWEELFVPEQRKLLMQLLDRIEVSENDVKLHLKKNILTQWVGEAQQHGNGHDCHSPAA